MIVSCCLLLCSGGEDFSFPFQLLMFQTKVKYYLSLSNLVLLLTNYESNVRDSPWY